MSFDSITNRGEYFSNHYLDVVISGDLGDLRKRVGRPRRTLQEPTGRSRIRGLGAKFFAARADATEASASRSPDAIRHLNDLVLEALGFTPTRQTLTLSRSTVKQLTVPVATTVITGTGLLLRRARRRARQRSGRPVRHRWRGDRPPRQRGSSLILSC